MKSYKEMADNVFSRIAEEKTMEIKKHHSRNYMATSFAVFGLVLLIGVGIWIGGKVTIGGPGPWPDSETESNAETEKELGETKEVVFLNRITEPQLYDSEQYGYIGVWSKLWFDEKIDAEALYAYRVTGIKDWLMWDTIQMLQEEGFLFVTDYPSDDVVIAGKMEDFERVFSSRNGYKGFYLGVEAVTRPDMEEILVDACGVTSCGSDGYTVEWFDAHFEEIASMLGTDKNRVSLFVQVANTMEVKKPVPEWAKDQNLLERMELAVWNCEPGDDEVLGVEPAFQTTKNGLVCIMELYQSMLSHPEKIYAIDIAWDLREELDNDITVRELEAQLKAQGITSYIYQDKSTGTYRCGILVTVDEFHQIQLKNVEIYYFYHTVKSYILGME